VGDTVGLADGDTEGDMDGFGVANSPANPDGDADGKNDDTTPGSLVAHGVGVGNPVDVGAAVTKLGMLVIDGVVHTIGTSVCDGLFVGVII